MSSTIIKAGTNGSVLRSLSTVDLADHLAEAAQITAEARRQAAELLAQSQAQCDATVRAAMAQADRIREQARKSGFDDGRAQGLALGEKLGRETALAQETARLRSEHAHLIDALQTGLRQIQVIKEGVRSQVENEVLSFALRLVRKMTYHVGANDTQAVRENVYRALRFMMDRSKLTIRVHTADEAAIRAYLPDVLGDINQLDDVKLVADESLQPGGCVVESQTNTVDASLDTQLAAIIEAALGKQVPHA